MCGFIARQLVETSQTVKFAQALLGVKYPDTKIVPVKASLSHDLREAAGLAKCREANDFHHAHDAYLACCLGLFIQKQHPGIYEHPIKYAKVMRDFVRAQSDLFNKSHKAPGSSGFIVGSFMQRKIDKDTGEIEWDAPQEVEDIRKALNYRQCFITRTPVEDSGAFWDANPLSPRDPSKGANLSLPLKKGLDPQIYGGYSSQKFAHFFIYEAKNKKNRTVFRFAGVPVYLAPLVRRGKKELVNYACQLAESEGYEFVRIERAKLLKKQLIEINGERFLLRGKEKVRNATELAFSIEEVTFLQKCILTQQGKFCDNLSTNVCADDIMNRLLGESKKLATKLLNQIKLEELHENFIALTEEEKAEVLCRILSLVNASQGVVNLTPIKGAREAGCMKFSFSKELSDPKTDFYIIDQSVTGIFEKRTRVGL